MKLSVTELTALAGAAFRGLGLRPEDAELVAQVLVTADLFGLHTHGVSRIESYGERIEIGGIAARPDIRVEPLATVIARVDGANGVGPLVGMRSLQTAMDIASRHGAAVVLARRSNHFGPIAPYNWFAAQKGFASIIGSNATTTIAPWGGSDARLGNSPIGFAVPRPGADPFMLDMALSVVARAKIREALKRGESIPADWATDPQGRPTTDPAVALKGFLQAIGGHKGYGLALWVDLFAGLLSNAAYLTHIKSWVDAPDEPQNLGHFFILIDTRVLGSTDWLAERMSDFASILQASPPIDPDRPVIMPGKIEFDSMRRSQTSGIDVDDSTLATLRRHADKGA